jgi:aspartyl-tRNA(Asn)/glutamyl-tRNA(Gln) amidotransferase subunit B
MTTRSLDGAPSRDDDGAGRAYEMVVGLEVHVQLKTATKIFCGCSTDFGAPPNANTCPTCLGLPGALPVLNERAVELGVRAALALGCAIQPVSIFARKNYFYPDLPKGYQISQFDRPLALGGGVDIGSASGGGGRRVRLTRLHLEEDAGKSIHDRYPSATAVDLNRAGTPLAEIVSEPDMHAVAEVDAYLRALREILAYAGVSDVNMEEGSLRVDANVSTRRRGDAALGTKTEVKNMNSFSGVSRALELEFARQCALLDDGRPVVQQTMLWDAHADEVRPARGKEGSHDYRYFPDPDLPPLVLGADRIGRVATSLPELPMARRHRYRAAFATLTEYDVDLLTSSPEMGVYFERVAAACGDAKSAANWVLGDVLAALKRTGEPLERFGVAPDALAALIGMVRDDAVSRTAAKQVFARMMETGRVPEAIARDEKLLKVADDRPLLAWIDDVIVEHPDEAARFLAGERRLQGVLVGYVMRKSQGSADPKRVNQLLGARAGT